MLSYNRDDVVPSFPIHLGNALDCQVVAFGRTRGENDFFWRRTNQLGDALAGKVHSLFGGPAEGVVTAGSVAELFREVGQHLFEYTGIGRGRRMVVHVNRQLDSGSRSPFSTGWLASGRDIWTWGNRFPIRAHDCLLLE